MKPNFALSLSFEGIGLLHRAFPGWHLVGDVPLNSGDLATELGHLRDKARALDPSGLHTKLVLPAEQIKYMQIEAPSEEDVADAVRAALVGATPYAVDDLAYDYSVEAGQIHIAACARETLAEAEQFAVDHDFNPVSFVAMPANGAFAGEPFFGTTEHFAASGKTASDLKRDMAPIRIIGASKPADPTPPAETAAPRAAQNEPHHAADDAPIAEADIAESAPGADTVTPSGPVPVSGSALAAPSQETGAEPQEPDAAPDVAAFSSIRATRDGAVTAPLPRLDGALREPTRPPRINLRPFQDDMPPEPPVPVTGVADSSLPLDGLPSREIRPASADRLVGPSSVTAPVTGPEAPDMPAARHAPEPSAAAPSFFTRRQRARQAPVSASPALSREEENRRMTIFGARDSAVTRGKPRFLGLILTAVLLLFMIGIAAWASIFMEDGLARLFRGSDAPVITALPEAATQDEATEPEMELASVPAREPVSLRDDPATEILRRVSPRDLTADVALARYAATGIWQLAPDPPAAPEAAQMDDFYQTSLDPAPDFRDAIALPDTVAIQSDALFFTPPSPPSAQTTFVLDARGFVQASATGALTPDGVRVFAGRPVVTPPFAQKPDIPAEQTATAAADTVALNAQLAAIRPRLRPGNAAEQIERSALSGRTVSELAALRPRQRPMSVQEAAEAAAAQALAYAEAEATRAQAEAEAATAAQASTVDLAALEGAVAEAVAQPDLFAGATPEAVNVSLKPNTRPRNFDKIVRRTERNQQKQTQRDDFQEEGEEPVRVASSAKITPKIPSAASVSKAATERKALKFDRVNLIGVYGTSSDRRALVRMSNGRYQKVKVGDRLDGGKVRAIGENELQYQKGGRNIVLKMPRG